MQDTSCERVEVLQAQLLLVAHVAGLGWEATGQKSMPNSIQCRGNVHFVKLTASDPFLFTMPLSSRSLPITANRTLALLWTSEEQKWSHSPLSRSHGYAMNPSRSSGTASPSLPLCLSPDLRNLYSSPPWQLLYSQVQQTCLWSHWHSARLPQWLRRYSPHAESLLESSAWAWFFWLSGTVTTWVASPIQDMI